MTPLQQYNVLVLDLMCRLAATGQYKRLLRYGVRKDQIPRLKSITADDREAVANSGNGIVPEPKVDPEAIDQLLRNVARRHDGHLLELRLIRAGAGQRMMEDWFGMESHEFADTRALLGIKGVGTGRYPKPDPETEHRIWRAWHDAADEADEAARLLRVHDETGVPVRIIWDFLVATEIRGREPRRTAKRRSRNRTPSEEPDHG